MRATPKSFYNVIPVQSRSNDPAFLLSKIALFVFTRINTGVL